MKKSKIPYLHERHGRLYVRIQYRKPDGRMTSKERAVANEREALTAIAEIKHQLGEGGPAVFEGERMTFAELVDEYRRTHDKPRWYLDPLEQYFGQRRIRTITYGDLKRFKQAREAVKRANGHDRKPATINRELEQLRAVLLLAVRHGWLLRNPFLGGPPLIVKSEEDRRDRVPTPFEEARMLAVCIPPRAHLRPLIIASRDTGLRKSALLSLVWRDVDLENGLLLIPRGNRYKRRPKVIAMTARLQEEMERLSAGSGPDQKVFGEVKDFKRSYATACRLAGIEDLRFNDWRHGFATDLLEAGIPERLAMKAAGHANASTHAIYANLDERISRQIAEALDRLHAERNGDEIHHPSSKMIQ